MPPYYITKRNQCTVMCVIVTVTWSDAGTERWSSRMSSAGNQLNRRTFLTRTSPGQTNRCTAFSLGDMSVYWTFTLVVYHRHPACTASSVYIDRPQTIDQHHYSLTGQRSVCQWCCHATVNRSNTNTSLSLQAANVVYTPGFCGT